MVLNIFYDITLKLVLWFCAGKRDVEVLNQSLDNQSVTSSQGSCETQSNPPDDIESNDGTGTYAINRKTFCNGLHFTANLDIENNFFRVVDWFGRSRNKLCTSFRRQHWKSYRKKVISIKSLAIYKNLYCFLWEHCVPINIIKLA